MKHLRFPEDFAITAHRVVLGGTQWLYQQPMNMPEPPVPNPVTISIVGGGSGLMGDGVRTFEMYDFREDEPQGYLTKEEINTHLKDNPI